MNRRAKNPLSREERMLHRRCRAAFEEQDDEALMKLITCLCKLAEAEAKLGLTQQQSVEVVLRDDPASEGNAP